MSKERNRQHLQVRGGAEKHRALEKGRGVMGRVNKRTSLAELAQIASQLASITSAFLPPASMESKGNEMVGSSEEELFMLSDESLTVCGGLRGKWRGECAARVPDSPLTGKSFAPNVSAYQRWTGIGGLDERTC